MHPTLARCALRRLFPFLYCSLAIIERLGQNLGGEIPASRRVNLGTFPTNDSLK
jgi:hypothetical protein